VLHALPTDMTAFRPKFDLPIRYARLVWILEQVNTFNTVLDIYVWERKSAGK
jgi:hypothetical protein